jgi:hypothetical protein
LYPDVALGRIPGDSVTEINRHFNKIITHAENAANDGALLVGEQLDTAPTWGGDLKDYVYGEMGGIAYDTLYERDGTFSGTAVINAINTDQYDVVNHMGHSNVTYNMGLTPSDMGDLTNDDPVLIYSQGCYSGSFDNRTTTPGTYTGDSMAENFTLKTSSAAWAYVGNSRYGWYSSGSLYGASNLFDREFMTLCSMKTSPSWPGVGRFENGPRRQRRKHGLQPLDLL